MIHAREADADIGAHPRGGNRAGRLSGRSALLHRRPRTRAAGRRARALYLVHRHPDASSNSDELRAIAAELPADRILVETDAPYLAPGKYRGKRNEPAYVTETAKVLAAARGVSVEQIARQTTANFFRLFNKVPQPSAAAA